MLRRFYGFCLILLGVSVGACSQGGDVELTLVNQNVALNTQIAEVRSTATYAADALDVTVEYIGTAMQQVTQQYGVLSLTMAASGMNPAAVTPGAQVPVPTQPALASNVPPAIQSSNGTPLPTLQDMSGAGSTTVVTPSADAVSAEPALFNIVTASGVGANDCALGSVTSFTTATPEIYVVATASNIPAGTTLSSSWQSPDGGVVNHSFTPDFNIQENCIWFYIDQVDVVFTPGSWSVQLAINNQPAGQAVNFTISE